MRHAYFSQLTGVLDGAGAATIVVPCYDYRHATIVLKNTHVSNAITSATFSKIAATLSGPDTATTTAVGSIAAGVLKLVEYTFLSCKQIQIVLAGTAASTYAVEANLVD